MLQLLKEIFTWWNRRTLSLRLALFWKGVQVGEDRYGNHYYTYGKRRYVVYAGEVEPTAVPVSWHRWLHRLTNVIPSSQKMLNQGSSLFYPPTINKTGTPLAHEQKLPPNKHYTSWNPENLKNPQKQATGTQEILS